MHSEKYPSRPILMIVPYPQAGGSDNRGRVLAKHLAPVFGVEIEVSNINWRGGHDGQEAVANAEPDGHTVGFISVEVNILHWLGITHLTCTDYTPLARSFTESAGVIVRTESGFRTLADLIEQARTSGTMGSGAPNMNAWHFALAGLLDAAKIDLDKLGWVPTRSGEEGVEKVIAGEAQVAPISLADALSYMRKGQVRALANMDNARHPLFPDVPTVKESTGLDWTFSLWRGLVGPKGLTPEVRTAWSSALHEVSKNPDFIAECADRGFTTDWCFDDEFAAFMGDENVRLGQLVSKFAKRI